MNELALCAGIGGISLGLKLAVPETRTVCYVEREAFCVEHLASKGEAGLLDCAPVWSDLATFDGRPWRGIVDLVSAGFPCQPFSEAGQRLGVEDERWLWPDIERVLEEVEPGAVFIENVPGLVRRGLADVLRGLARLGFDAEWEVFSAIELGAPHIRKRIFLLAAHSLREQLWSKQGGAESVGPGAAESRDNSSNRDLACPDSNSCGQSQQPESDDEPISRVEGKGRNHTQRFRTSIPDPDSQGSSGSSRPQHSQGSQSEPDRRGWWTPESDVGRVAHGVADRVDRLRAIGNGVVPLVVAHAFRTLAARF